MLHTTPIVFVVDDDISVRMSLESLIDSAGWRSETFASAQAFNLVTPESGLPHLIVCAFLLTLLLNTLAAGADRVRTLGSLLVVFGSTFILKFIVLAALSEQTGGRLKRVLLVLLEGVTLGTLTQDVLHPANGYLAFFTLALFLVGLGMLPAERGTSESQELIVVRGEG